MLTGINKLLEYKWFPVSLRIVTFIAFFWLVIIGFSSPTNDPFFLSQLSKTNLTGSFVWRLWWPMIVLTAIFLGRVWCMVCPVEMVTSFFAKIGFRMKRPKWILSGWIITIFYFIVLTAGIIVLQIDLNPGYTSYYLLIIMGIAILSGLLFEKNTFCRYICPVGYLLGIFSKMSAWGWRVKKRAVCDSCKDKSCISSNHTYQLNYKSCGVDLVPAEINNNSHCLLCGGCLKTCNTYKTNNNSARPNPYLVKTGFAADLLQLKPIRQAEWIFLFFLTGSMIFEMTHFKVISDISASLFPWKISVGLGLTEGIRKDLTAVVYLFFLLPLLIWIVPYLLTRSSGFRMSWSTYMNSNSLIFLPVIAAFFTGLSVMEILTRVPYYKYILKDVRGVETIKAMLFRQIEMPQLPYWAELIFILILISSLVTGIFISFKVIRKLEIKSGIQEKRAIVYFLPVIFILILVIETFMFLCF
jgi:polyferredoxin